MGSSVFPLKFFKKVVMLDRADWFGVQLGMQPSFVFYRLFQDRVTEDFILVVTWHSVRRREVVHYSFTATPVKVFACSYVVVA